MSWGAIIGLICVAAGGAPLTFGFLTGAMPPTLPRVHVEGPAYRDEDRFGYWLNATFYAGIVGFGCYTAILSW